MVYTERLARVCPSREQRARKEGGQREIYSITDIHGYKGTAGTETRESGVGVR